MGAAMTHGADIIRPDFGDDSILAMERKAMLSQMLMAEAFAQLIRHRLSAAPHPGIGAVRRDLHLITQLRHSGLAKVRCNPDQTFTLSMYDHTATASTTRGALWEWSNAVLGTTGTPA